MTDLTNCARPSDETLKRLDEACRARHQKQLNRKHRTRDAHSRFQPMCGGMATPIYNSGTAAKGTRMRTATPINQAEYLEVVNTAAWAPENVLADYIVNPHGLPVEAFQTARKLRQIAASKTDDQLRIDEQHAQTEAERNAAGYVLFDRKCEREHKQRMSATALTSITATQTPNLIDIPDVEQFAAHMRAELKLPADADFSHSDMQYVRARAKEQAQTEYAMGAKVHRGTTLDRYVSTRVHELDGTCKVYGGSHTRTFTAEERAKK